MYRALRIGLGGLLIVLGIIGLFLPILQGFLFLGIGGVLLYKDVPYFPRLVRKLRKRFPSLDLEARESMVRGLQSDHPHIVAGAVGQTLLRYYGADTVVRALGLEARAPHPQGYTVDDTDWALLEPVRKMGRIYKTATGQGDAS